MISKQIETIITVPEFITCPSNLLDYQGDSNDVSVAFPYNYEMKIQGGVHNFNKNFDEKCDDLNSHVEESNKEIHHEIEVVIVDEHNNNSINNIVNDTCAN